MKQMGHRIWSLKTEVQGPAVPLLHTQLRVNSNALTASTPSILIIRHPFQSEAGLGGLFGKVFFGEVLANLSEIKKQDSSG